MIQLTQKQEQLLYFLKSYIENNNNCPSYPEIQSHFGYACLSSVYKHLRVLKKKGVIQINKKASLPISIAKIKNATPLFTYHLPLVGALNDEGEIEEYDHKEKVVFTTPKKMPRNCYVLKIEGGNYLEAGLLHKDYAIIEPRDEAIVGETVIAQVYEESIVIKKYHPQLSYTRLDSFCLQIDPMMVVNEEIDIYGVMLGMIRNY